MAPINYIIADVYITLKAHIAQQEREKAVARINQGLSVTNAKGKTLDKPKIDLPSNFIKEYKKFKDGDHGDMSTSEFAKMLGIGRSTLYSM
jgi:DNA invertase Pin-like site-specific DNA recombinase